MKPVFVPCGKCETTITVSPLHPRFPRGPFFCRTCEAKMPKREGETLTPDDDQPTVAIGNMSAEGVEIDVTKRW